MSQETQLNKLDGRMTDEDSRLVDSILNDLNTPQMGQQQMGQQQATSSVQKQCGQMNRPRPQPSHHRHQGQCNRTKIRRSRTIISNGTCPQRSHTTQVKRRKLTLNQGCVIPDVSAAQIEGRSDCAENCGNRRITPKPVPIRNRSSPANGSLDQRCRCREQCSNLQGIAHCPNRSMDGSPSVTTPCTESSPHRTPR